MFPIMVAMSKVKEDSILHQWRMSLILAAMSKVKEVPILHWALGGSLFIDRWILSNSFSHINVFLHKEYKGKNYYYYGLYYIFKQFHILIQKMYLVEEDTLKTIR